MIREIKRTIFVFLVPFSKIRVQIMIKREYAISLRKMVRFFFFACWNSRKQLIPTTDLPPIVPPEMNKKMYSHIKSEDNKMPMVEMMNIKQFIWNTHFLPYLSAIIGTITIKQSMPMQYMEPMRPIKYLSSQVSSYCQDQLSKYSGSFSFARYLSDGRPFAQMSSFQHSCHYPSSSDRHSYVQGLCSYRGKNFSISTGTRH